MANVMSDFDIDEFKRMNEDGQQNFLTKNHLVSDNLSN